MGEHAVVYGRPALVATVGLRVTVRATRESIGSPPGVQLDLLDLEHHERTTWPDLVDFADRARVAWNRYSEDPSPARFAEVATGDPAHLVKVALGELAREMGGARAERRIAGSSAANRVGAAARLRLR